MEEQDFKVGDVVCVFSPKRIEGEIDGVDTCGAHVKQQGWFNYGLLRSGTWEQNFGNLPTIKPKRKVKRWINLYRHRNNVIRDDAYLYYSAEEAEEAAMNESGFVAVAVEIELDE